MEANDNAGCLAERVVWTFFASRLAPTEDPCRTKQPYPIHRKIIGNPMIFL